MNALKNPPEEISKESKTKYIVKDAFKEPDQKKRQQRVLDLIIKHIKNTGGKRYDEI